MICRRSYGYWAAVTLLIASGGLADDGRQVAAQPSAQASERQEQRDGTPDRVKESAAEDVQEDQPAVNEPSVQVPHSEEQTSREYAQPDDHQTGENGQSADRPAVQVASPPSVTCPSIDRGGSLLLRSLPPPPPPVAANAVSGKTLPPDDDSDFEPGELLVMSADMDAARSAAQQLRSWQVRIKSRQALDQLGLVISVFRLPTGTDTGALLAQIRKSLPNLEVDTNQRYQLLSSARRGYAHRILGWPNPTSVSCVSNLRIGMLDTPVTESHPALVGRAIRTRNFASGLPAEATHGTAVASLLVGNASAGYPGLLPEAELWAANVFRQRGDATETTTETLLHALNWLLEQQVAAINLSLGGQRNRVLERAWEQVFEKGIIVVAAAGNQGPDGPPVYPAAHPGVIAVTAVDAAEHLYAQANVGDYIDFAAPGVDVWAADGEGKGQYHTGTSFAAPFVTAALLLEGVNRQVAEQNDWLIQVKQGARDLGREGKDNQFGWGLLVWPDPCRP